MLPILLLSFVVEVQPPAGVAALPSGSSQPSQPNVLVIVADDFGWSERSLLPSLDALADAGTTFERAYVYPTCSVARIGLMLGQYARRYGVGDLSMNAWNATHDKLPLSAVFISELFAPTYATMLIGKWHLGRAPLIGEMNQVTSGPFCQGFEGWRAGSPTVINAGPESSGYYDWQRVQAGDAALSTEYATTAQRSEFVNWWQNTTSPKFCVLAWSAPHFPFDAPPGFTLQPTARQNYEQVIEYLDSQLALVLDAVSLADTYVFFLSDNGPEDGARPPGTPVGVHKGTTFEGGIRVPLIVAGPGVAQGTSQRLVSVVDIAETAAELAGIAVPAGFDDSRSFANALGTWEGEPARTWVFAERYEVTAAGLGGTPHGYDDQAIIHSKWKLRHVDEDGSGMGGFIDRWYFISAPGVEEPLTPSQTIQDTLLAELAALPARAP